MDKVSKDLQKNQRQDMKGFTNKTEGDDFTSEDEDGGTSEQDERTGSQVNPVVMKNSHNMVPLAKKKSSPGNNIMNLRDRGKSASRVEGSRRFEGL